MASTSPPHSDEAGFAAGYRIAGYRLEREIGRGGMAVVFAAHDERLDRQVALKILAPSLAQDQVFRQRFIAESRAAAGVEDPHIIPVYEAGESNGVLFIAMRLVRGGDLRTLVAQTGPLAPDRAEWLVSAVASALDAAHARGLVHRDVKPANMLLDVRPGRPDHVYLSDFGLSKTALSSGGLSGAGQFVGTVDYAAPEQILGRPVDGRTDQYALGCAAFELLCGKPPYSTGEMPAALYAHLSAKVPVATAARPDLPTAVDGVFARVLAKSPADRYQSCLEFARALRAALGLKPHAFEAAEAAAATFGLPGDSRESTLHPAQDQLASGLTESGADTDPQVTSQLAFEPRAAAASRWRRGGVLLSGAVAAILIAGGLTAAWLGRAHGSAAVARDNFGGQTYPGGLELTQQWILAGPGGSSLRVGITLTNTSSKPVTAQLEEPSLPPAITSDPASVTFPSEVQPLLRRPLLVWDMGLPAHGREIVSYQVPEPSLGVSEHRLEMYVQAYGAVSWQQSLLVVPSAGRVKLVSISPARIHLKLGGTRQLKAHVELVNPKVTLPGYRAGAVWWTSNAAVVTVSRDGVIRATGLGNALVWVEVGTIRTPMEVVVDARPPGPSGSSPTVSGSDPAAQPSTSPSPSPSTSGSSSASPSPTPTQGTPSPTSSPAASGSPGAGAPLAARLADRELTPA